MDILALVKSRYWLDANHDCTDLSFTKDQFDSAEPIESLKMIISSQIFEAYLECSTKCWLRSRAEPIAGNAYAEWVRAQNEAYYERGLERLLAMLPESDRAMEPPISRNSKDVTWRVGINLHLRTNNLQTHLRAVERMPSKERGGSVEFVPYRFEFANKITKSHKLSLAFDAHVLSGAAGREVSVGKIMHGDGQATLKVKLSSLASGLQKQVKDITALLADNSPPDLVLNRHCHQCEFQARCRKQAAEKDELSLLSGMSEKERRKLRSKGIFTVTQLSYTFRPRRRRRELGGKQEKFHHALRALAIRKNKIHALDLLDPKLDGTPVYLDVEGLPDRDFYYLIGTRVGTGGGAVQHSFWADNEQAEKRIWEEFLDVLSAIPNPKIIHFGSYETVFMKRMRERYAVPRQISAAAAAIEHAVNLLSFVFAHIYFPTFSNGLKEIARYLGFQWSGSPASGLEAIVWRHHWEASRDPRDKQELLNYNREDCKALELVANRIINLHLAMPHSSQAASQNDFVLASEIKRESPFPFRFGPNKFAFPELETINKAAYWDYQRERIYVKSHNKSPGQRKRHWTARSTPKPNTTIECPRASSCPACKSKVVYRNGTRSKILLDLQFMRHGIKRWITRYVRINQRCRSCRKAFYRRDPRWPRSKYGSALAAYTVYQNIELRLSQGLIAASMQKLFDLPISRNTVNQFKAATAERYKCTYDALLKRLCSGRLLHVDETSASVQGKDCYVWVLTSMEDVAYFHTPTREGTVIQTMLKTFSGVLVSDFYAAYDAIECPQQKGLIHFIRDLNEELLKQPFDESLKRLVAEFAGLVKPIVETVDQRGLKKRFLGKHRVSVDRFYKRLVGGFGTSDAARKFVERLQKNRNRMFTFLEFDNVPWNNNNAEHAVKAFASLRRVIEGKATEKGLRDFLILLSICETCKYKSVDFLDFLRSDSKSIDEFAISQRKGRRGSAG
jgi:predicted RecB family nuclease